MNKNSLRVVLLVLGIFLAGHAKPANAQALSWWVENASMKVMQDRSPQPIHAVSLQAARNEYEPFQVVLRADGGNLSNTDARMSDLIGPNGAIIPSENVTLYRAWYVNVTEASGHGGVGDPLPGNPRALGEYVDPLIPFFDPYDPRHLAVGTPFSIVQNRLQPIYGDIYIPADTPPGDYAGTLRVTVGFVVAAEVPIRLHVWNFTLSNTRRVATAYGISFGSILDYHGGPDGAWDDEALGIMKNYEETLHNFRVDLTNVVQGPPYLPSPFFTFDGDGNLNPPDYTAFDEQMGARFNGTRFKDGVGALMLNNELFSPGHGRSMTDDQYMKAAANFAQHLKAKGWWEHIYVYVHDEPWLFPGAYEAIAYDVAVMKMGDPDWVSRMMATNHWVKELQYSIGIWCPLTGNYDNWNWSQPEYGREDYQRLIEAGQKLWFYVCNATFSPYAGYDIDTLWGHEPRILMWGSWYEGASGLLYWDTNYWWGDDPWGTLLNTISFPWIARTGDGFVLYPGDHNGTQGPGIGSPSNIAMDGPVITIRLLMTREGLEDWEYLLIAEDLGGKDYAKSIAETIYTKLGVNPAMYDQDNPPWTYDDNEIYTARQTLGDWIEAMQNPAPAPAQPAEEEVVSRGGCVMSSRSDANSITLLALLAVIALPVILFRAAHRSGKGSWAMKTTKLMTLAAICLMLGTFGCGQSSGGGDDAAAPVVPPPPIPAVVDHAFDNALSAPGNIPADLDPSGPVISGVQIVPDSMIIQGQSLTFNVSFNDPEGDLTAATLFVQVMGFSEYWTFGPDQFGAIIGGTAVVHVEPSSHFEPEAYVLMVGLRDDAGHIGNIFTTVFIVLTYTTPEIESLEPADLATDVPLNVPVRGVFSNPVLDEPVSLTLTQNGIAVPGTFRLLPTKKAVTFIPDDFLTPGTVYVATLTVGLRTASHTFTTASPVAVPDLTGRVFSVTITPDKIIEPTGAEILFWTLTIPPILVKVKTFDDVNGIATSVGALSKGDPLMQDPGFAILRFPDSGAFLVNPYFSMGPAILNMDLYIISGGLIDTSVNIYGFTLTGNFADNGESFEHVIITGYLDAAEINKTVNDFMPGTGIPFNVCINLPGSCDEANLVGFRAQYFTGPHEPQVTDLYDLSVVTNPITVPRATGGTVNVTGEYSLNGDASGVHTVNLVTTHGTFPGGVTSINRTTASGLYSTTLTIPAGLAAGTRVTVTATSSSPVGNLVRKARVTVQ